MGVNGRLVFWRQYSRYLRCRVLSLGRRVAINGNMAAMAAFATCC